MVSRTLTTVWWAMSEAAVQRASPYWPHPLYWLCRPHLLRVISVLFWGHRCVCAWPVLSASCSVCLGSGQARCSVERCFLPVVSSLTFPAVLLGGPQCLRLHVGDAASDRLVCLVLAGTPFCTGTTLPLSLVISNHGGSSPDSELLDSALLVPRTFQFSSCVLGLASSSL